MITVDKRGRLRDPGPGWTVSGKNVFRLFAHESGWVVSHCGHPTATTPWAVYDPEGRIHLSGCDCAHGRAFQHVAEALRHVEAHLDGRLKQPGRMTAPHTPLNQPAKPEKE